MPHNQNVRDTLFNAFLDGPVGLTRRQAAQLADVAVDALEGELEDARMFRWISQNATIHWLDANHTDAQICFPVKADMFDTIEEALRRSRGETPDAD